MKTTSLRMYLVVGHREELEMSEWVRIHHHPIMPSGVRSLVRKKKDGQSGEGVGDVPQLNSSRIAKGEEQGVRDGV